LEGWVDRVTTSPPRRAGSPFKVAIKASTVRIDGCDAAVAVVLPAFNEELTIGDTIEAFHRALPGASIVVVDNNSTDTTRSCTLKAFEAIEGRGVLLTELRQGKGFAVRRAFRSVSADVFVLTDADMTYPADRVLDLIRPIVDDEADMVVGNRLEDGRYEAENKRRFHGFGNRLVLWVVNRLFRAHLGDIMSGYRAVSSGFVAGYPILVNGFEIETDMTLHALDKRFRVEEIPVAYRDRPVGSVSKLRTISDGRRVLWSLVHVVRHYRPLLFFGTAGVLLGLAGALAAAPVMSDWFQYRFIYHVPLAILATGLEIIALLSFGIGLILDSVVHLERMAYERDLMARRFE
jgi:glycosyltransferase involved in cell wall biosynthesis